VIAGLMAERNNHNYSCRNILRGLMIILLKKLTDLGADVNDRS